MPGSGTRPDHTGRIRVRCRLARWQNLHPPEPHLTHSLRKSGAVALVALLADRLTMLRLNARQRTALSETCREFANLAGGALVVGQALSGQRFSWWLMVVGIAFWFGFIAVGMRRLEGE
jgi:hypothetical protein